MQLMLSGSTGGYACMYCMYESDGGGRYGSLSE